MIRKVTEREKNRYGLFLKRIIKESKPDSSLNTHIINKEIFKGISEIIVFSNTMQPTSFLMDTSDVDSFAPDKIRLYVKYNPNRTMTYLTDIEGHTISRMITNCPEGSIVTYIDGDRHNLCRSNLTVVPIEYSRRRISCYSEMHPSDGLPLGITVRKDDYSTRYVVAWVDLNGRRFTKSFSLNKYGKEKALELAKEFNSKQRKLNKYIK